MPGAFYATPFHRFVARVYVFPVALAPLAVRSTVGYPLLAAPMPPFALFVFRSLVVDAVGTSGPPACSSRPGAPMGAADPATDRRPAR